MCTWCRFKQQDISCIRQSNNLILKGTCNCMHDFPTFSRTLEYRKILLNVPVNIEVDAPSYK